MTRRSAVLSAVVVALFAGCKDKPHAAADAAPPPAASQVPANVRVALADPPGTTDADRAVADAQAVVRREGERADAWVALGHAWVRKARVSHDRAFYVNAEACASVVLGRDPDDAAATNLRSIVLLERHAFEEARQLGERITARRPADPVGWGNLSDALRELGRYDEANDAAQKMLELRADLASLTRVGRLQWLRGDVTGAKKSLASAIDASGGDPGAWAEEAMIRWHEGDYDGAGVDFDKALEHVADFAPALAGKGRVAMAKGDFRVAADFFARAYQEEPSVETAWLLGDACAAGRQTACMEQGYALARGIRETDPRTYSLFLTTKRDPTKEERDDAIRLAGAEHVKHIDVYTEDAMAWALYRAGMIPAARTTVARARRLGTPDARLLFHEGAIRIADGDVKKGRELVARALALNPAFDWRGAREAKELLR